VWARRLWLTEDGTLRAVWRIGLFLGVALVATMLCQGLLWLGAPIVRGAMDLLAPAIGGMESRNLLVQGIITVVALLVAHEVSLRRVDRLPWSAAGLGRSNARPGLLGWNALLGALAIGIPSLLLAAAGWMRFQPDGPGSSLAEALRALVVLAPLAFGEELMLRGYILTVLRKSLDWRVAVALTSIVFGLLHLANPDPSVLSIGVVVLAGVLLGTVVVVTGSLYAATALHLAWNWMMAGVLHTSVSGLGTATPDYQLVDAGPDWLTGGTWGPEGGIGAVFGMSVVLAFLYVRRDRPREAQRE
jgi:membrane protease YdiL (CAAX protease family)